MLKNIILWTLALAIAVTAAVTAMGAIAKDKAPALAVTLSPMNGFAAESLAAASVRGSVVKNGNEFPDRIESITKRMARKAFVEEPITPEAVAVLALGERENRQRELMSLAHLLSRRQPLITGWLIVDSGERNNIPAVLDHYDTLLRTSSSAAPVVIPTLARALANGDFIEPFKNTLLLQPPWAAQFWGAVVSIPDSLENSAILREALHNRGESDSTYRDAALIRALITNQQFEQAFSLYRLLSVQKNTGLLVGNGTFEVQPAYSPIDWELISTGEFGAAINDGKLELSAIRNAGGIFVRQLIKLPPRTLVMAVKPDAPISDDAQIFVTLACAQAIKEPPRIIRIPLKRKIENLKIDNTNSGCSFYWLDISGRSSENGDGFDIGINSISLR